MVAELRLQIKDVIQRIDRITPKVKIISSIERITNYLPLKSIEDIRDMEIRLQQQDFLDEYVSIKNKIIFVCYAFIIYKYYIFLCQYVLFFLENFYTQDRWSHTQRKYSQCFNTNIF